MDHILDGQFSASRTRTKRNLVKYDLDLTAGLVDKIIATPGTLVYLDRVSTGFVSIEINQEQAGSLDPLTFVAGDSLECPFNMLKLNAPPQSGKTLRLIIGEGVSIRGGTGLSTGSGGIATSVTAYPGGATYGASYAATAALAANTPDTIFTPAANTGGAVVWAARYSSLASAGSSRFSLLAKASAPGTVVDGDVLLLGTSQTTSNVPTGVQLSVPVKVPAGKGLYRISDTAEANPTAAHVLYSLL